MMGVGMVNIASGGAMGGAINNQTPGTTMNVDPYNTGVVAGATAQAAPQAEQAAPVEGEKKFCPQCGAENNGNFCTKCGTKLV